MLLLYLLFEEGGRDDCQGSSIFSPSYLPLSSWAEFLWFSPPASVLHRWYFQDACSWFESELTCEGQHLGEIERLEFKVHLSPTQFVGKGNRYKSHSTLWCLLQKPGSWGRWWLLPTSIYACRSKTAGLETSFFFFQLTTFSEFDSSGFKEVSQYSASLRF